MTRSGGDCYGEVTATRWLHEKTDRGWMDTTRLQAFSQSSYCVKFNLTFKIQFFKMQWPGFIPPKHVDAKQNWKLLHLTEAIYLLPLSRLKGPL